jgi:hypothetical protein
MRMIAAFELAGFFAAHAIWCMSDSDGLTPTLAYTTVDGERHMEHLAFAEAEAAVASGMHKLAGSEMDASNAALLFLGQIATQAGQLDAVIVEIRCNSSPQSEAVIAVAYTPRAAGRFLVHKPKLLLWKDCDDFDMTAALEAFFRGVAAHENGAKVWHDCLDESK